MKKISKEYIEQLNQYTNSEVEEFNDIIWDFLQDDSRQWKLQEAVAYFYLLLHTKENGI